MKKNYETHSKEILNASEHNQNKTVQKSNGIKLKVNFENLDLTDSEDSSNDLERNPLKKTASNLNRDAKLQWQQSLMNKKREANSHNDIQIKIGGNIPRSERSNGKKNIYSLNTNKPNNDFRSKPTAAHFLTHEIQEDQEQISNLNKNICKVRTAPNYVSKDILTNFNQNPSNRNFTSNLADEQRNEIMVKSIKILAVTQDSTKDYSSESEDNISLDSDKLKTQKSQRTATNHQHTEMLKQQHDSIDNEKNTSMMVAPLPNNHVDFNYDESGEHSVIEIKTEIESEPEIEKESEDSIDLSIFELLDKNSKKFILKPATMGLTLKCQIFRHKGIYSQYKFYLENLEGQLLLIMTARKRKKTKTTCYIINYISYDETNVEKYIETPIAKLKSNLMGTQFTLYDFGIKPSNASSHTTNSQTNMHRSSTSSNNEQKAHSSGASDTQCEEEATLEYDSDLKYLRKEYLSITYDFNIFGYKGPRQMSIIIPGMDNHFNREDFFIRNESDSIINAWRKLENAIQIKEKTKGKGRFGIKSKGSLKRNKDKNNKNYEVKDEEGEENSDEDEKLGSKFNDSHVNVVRLVNKTPGWHPQYRSFALNFNGRVTQPSVKNYQIVHEVNTDYIVTQFGKVNVDMYTCDYSYPLCSLQAFGIAISSLDNKFGCD